LETYVREQKSAPTQASTHASTQASTQEDYSDDNGINNVSGGDQLNNIIQEYNSRFELLAEEIGNLKDIVLKLQSYTLEVNKTLMEERINVFSDMGDSRQLSGENIVLEQMDDDVTSADISDMVNGELFIE
jgi:enamine deaminase RidA (YjgF/YER057c/UK114 family)